MWPAADFWKNCSDSILQKYAATEPVEAVQWEIIKAKVLNILQDCCPVVECSKVHSQSLVKPTVILSRSTSQAPSLHTVEEKLSLVSKGFQIKEESVQITDGAINEAVMVCLVMSKPLEEPSGESLEQRAARLEKVLAESSIMQATLNTFPHGRAIVKRANDKLCAHNASLVKQSACQEKKTTALTFGPGSY